MLHIFFFFAPCLKGTVDDKKKKSLDSGRINFSRACVYFRLSGTKSAKNSQGLRSCRSRRMPLVIRFKTLTLRNPPPSPDSCLRSAAIKLPACYQNTTEPQTFCWHKEFLNSVTKRWRAEPFHSRIKHPPRASLRNSHGGPLQMTIIKVKCSLMVLVIIFYIPSCQQQQWEIFTTSATDILGTLFQSDVTDCGVERTFIYRDDSLPSFNEWASLKTHRDGASCTFSASMMSVFLIFPQVP